MEYQNRMNTVEYSYIATAMEFKELSREHRQKKYMATYTNITKVCILVIIIYLSFDFLFCTNYSHLHASVCTVLT